MPRWEPHESPPFSPSSWGRGPAGQNPEPVTARPEMRETKGKQTGLEPGARCPVCPPPRQARMMDGCSQPARPPGGSRYLHNTGVPPVTSDTALPGAEARWPPRFLEALARGGGMKQPVKAQPDGGSPGSGKGRSAARSGLRIYGFLPTSHSWRGEEGTGDLQLQGERQGWSSRAFKSTRLPKS